MHDSAVSFAEGPRKIRKTNEKLKMEHIKPKQVNLVVVDIDGSLEDAKRRVPDNMLGHAACQFIFLYSDPAMIDTDRPPWFAVVSPQRQPASWPLLFLRSTITLELSL